MNAPFTLTSTNISVFFRGKMHTINNTANEYEPLVSLIREGDYEEEALVNILDKPVRIISSVSNNVVVDVDNAIVAYKGEEVTGVLIERLLEMTEEGFKTDTWENFLDNLMDNPSYSAREQLYEFLEKYSAPLTEDGCFIAFKNVRDDFKDIHSGKFDNSPGQVVEMDRTLVDDNPNNTCSAGLHACASVYLGSFYTDSSKTVVLKINPADVVSIPTDYNSAKMRVAKYEVLEEVEKEGVAEVESMSVYPDSESTYEEDPWEYDDDEFPDEWDCE